MSFTDYRILTKLSWLKYHNESRLAEERFFIINLGVDSNDRLIKTHLLEKVWSGNYCRTLSSRDCRHPEIWLRRTESMQECSIHKIKGWAYMSILTVGEKTRKITPTNQHEDVWRTCYKLPAFLYVFWTFQQTHLLV